MLESLRSGMAGFTEDAIVIVAASDLPALDAAAVDEFVDAVLARKLDVAYACLERRYHQAAYPEFPHTWARLRDGRYCGGGLVALRPRVLPRLDTFMDALGQARKSPWRLAGLFGLRRVDPLRRRPAHDRARRAARVDAARGASRRDSLHARADRAQRRPGRRRRARQRAIRGTVTRGAAARTSGRRDALLEAMRTVLLTALFSATLCTAAGAQTAAPSPAPAPFACDVRQANLGGVGRALTVAFTGPIFGARVCATVANLAFDGFDAQAAAAPVPDAVVAAALGDGGTTTIAFGGATLAAVGPYLVAPGGELVTFGADSSESARVVLAFAGQRVLVIATTPVALIDLARTLRDHPGLFDADAIERAVVIASGPQAAVSIRTVDGTLGAPSITTPRVLSLLKRG